VRQTSVIRPHPRRYVLTGAPGAGKTSVLRVLQELGFAVVEEAATDVIGSEQRLGIEEPWQDDGFVDKIADLQRQRQQWRHSEVHADANGRASADVGADGEILTNRSPQTGGGPAAGSVQAGGDPASGSVEASGGGPAGSVQAGGGPARGSAQTGSSRASGSAQAGGGPARGSVEASGGPARGSVQVHDRSTLCTLALARFLGRPVTAFLADEVDRVLREQVFEREVFLIRPIGFVERTGARRISYEESLAFERVHEVVYRQHGFEIIDVPPATAASRAAMIADRIALLG
jgi:predicted ATPase